MGSFLNPGTIEFEEALNSEIYIDKSLSLIHIYTFKGLRPDGAIQTFFLCIIRVTVGDTPLASGRRRQLCCRQPLQRFHTGIIIMIVCSKSTDPHLDVYKRQVQMQPFMQ